MTRQYVMAFTVGKMTSASLSLKLLIRNWSFVNKPFCFMRFIIKSRSFLSSYHRLHNRLYHSLKISQYMSLRLHDDVFFWLLDHNCLKSVFRKGQLIALSSPFTTIDAVRASNAVSDSKCSLLLHKLRWIISPFPLHKNTSKPKSDTCNSSSLTCNPTYLCAPSSDMAYYNRCRV